MKSKQPIIMDKYKELKNLLGFSIVCGIRYSYLLSAATHLWSLLSFLFLYQQFEHDISTLLETLGNPTHDHNTDLDGTEGNEGVWSSLLQQYLEANQTYFLSIPCCVSGELDVDEWSNEPEIDEAKIQALENCLDSSSGLEIVKEELMNRLEFSKKSVEKLYDIVNHQTTGQLATILTPLTEDRNIRTELDLLRDQVTKYKHEVITISAEMAYLKRKLQKAEKRLEAPVISNLSSTDTPVLTRSSSVQSVTTTTEKKDSVSSEHQNLDSMNVVEVIVHDTPLCQHNGEVVESRIVVTEAVSKLQQQLEEARQRMVAAEKSLTDYMASAPMTPPTNHAAEIARLQKLLTEVRTISNKKLADVRAEVLPFSSVRPSHLIRKELWWIRSLV